MSGPNRLEDANRTTLLQRLTQASMTRSIARSAWLPGTARADAKMFVSKAAFNGEANARAPAPKARPCHVREPTSNPATPEIPCTVATSSRRAGHPATLRSRIYSRRGLWLQLLQLDPLARKLFLDGFTHGRSSKRCGGKNYHRRQRSAGAQRQERLIPAGLYATDATQ
jgi:hypothetical protein